jgi:hypothetical protein
MEIGLVFRGRISMDDQGHVINVNASSSNVGCNEGNRSTFGEGGQVLHSSGLREVPVHFDCWHASEVQLFRELLGSTLHLGEHNGFAGS